MDIYVILSPENAFAHFRTLQIINFALYYMEHPRLIEGGVQSYLYDTLSTCHNNRVKIYSIALNVGVLVVFVLVVVAALYFCYKRKKTPYEIHQKMARDQEYVLSKIRYYQGEQQNLMTSPIG